MVRLPKKSHGPIHLGHPQGPTLRHPSHKTWGDHNVLPLWPSKTKGFNVVEVMIFLRTHLFFICVLYNTVHMFPIVYHGLASVWIDFWTCLRCTHLLFCFLSKTYQFWLFCCIGRNFQVLGLCTVAARWWANDGRSHFCAAVRIPSHHQTLLWHIRHLLRWFSNENLHF